MVQYWSQEIIFRSFFPKIFKTSEIENSMNNANTKPVGTKKRKALRTHGKNKKRRKLPFLSHTVLTSFRGFSRHQVSLESTAALGKIREASVQKFAEIFASKIKAEPYIAQAGCVQSLLLVVACCCCCCCCRMRDRYIHTVPGLYEYYISFLFRPSQFCGSKSHRVYARMDFFLH